MAYEPRAEERCRLDVRIGVREGEAEALVRDRELGEAAVDLVAGEARPVAQVLAAGEAERAYAAGPAEPRYAHAGAHLEPIHPRALPQDDPDNLVTQDQGELGVRELPIEHVKVRPADGARAHTEEDLIVAWFRRRELGEGQWSASPREHHGLHEPLSRDRTGRRSLKGSCRCSTLFPRRRCT